jgi:hypothetical protein
VVVVENQQKKLPGHAPSTFGVHCIGCRDSAEMNGVDVAGHSANHPFCKAQTDDKVFTLQLCARAAANVLIEQRTAIARISLWTATTDASSATRIGALNEA